MKQWQHRSVRLSEQAAAGWDRVCVVHNVSFTALLEAFGQLLGEGETPTPDQAAERAKQIDRQRRSRRS